MPNKQLERLAKMMIHEVRDEALTSTRRHFSGDAGPAQSREIHDGLVASLDEKEKDLLWKLLTEVVETTLGKVMYFVDHKRVTRMLRVTLLDPKTGTESNPLDVTGVDYIDLPNVYWFEWLEKYPRVRKRPDHERRLPPPTKSGGRPRGGRSRSGK